MEYHIKNGSVPSQLFINKFPEPFLKEDTIFIDEYNKIINECQIRIMQSCTQRLKDQIVTLKEKIIIY